jgi:hypothetical protein
MKRNLLMVAPLMLALSMWAYGQAGTMGGAQGSGQGQHAGTMGSGSNPNGAGAGTMDQTSNPGQNPSAAPGDMNNGQTSNTTANNSNNNNAGGKTLKGCIRSENGQYLLEEKGGKVASLSAGSDLAAHVGHQVKVHGNWEKAGSASTARSNGANTPSADTGTVASGSEPNGNTSAAANTGARAQASGSASDANSANAQGSVSDEAGRKMDHSGKVFQVASVDMVSETCSINSGDNNKKSNSSYGSQAGSPQGSSTQSSPSGQPPRK